LVTIYHNPEKKLKMSSKCWLKLYNWKRLC